MLTLMYITNVAEIASHAISCGADRIVIDLESRGKDIRQSGKTQKPHALKDIIEVRRKLPGAFITVRINPIQYSGTSEEIKFLIDHGADQIMLPYFHQLGEAEMFLSLVNGKSSACLLVETVKSLALIQELISWKEADEFYLGLNDLAIELGLDFPFKTLSGGFIADAVTALNSSSSTFGFGGLAPIDSGLVNGSAILGELLRHQASTVFLSRDFHHCSESLETLKTRINLEKEISRVRSLETLMRKRSGREESEDARKTYRLIDSIRSGR